jgi:ABC-type polysaccharide/polyol phosphate export permease
LPLTSLLALTWLYWDTRDPSKVVSLSLGIFWAVIPSLLFFVVLWALLKNGHRFGWSMLASCAVTALAYGLYVLILRKLGVHI